MEAQILDFLSDTLTRLTVQQPQHIPGRDVSLPETALAAVRRELAGADRQRDRLYELLEIGAYDLPLFQARMEALQEKRTALERKEAELLRAIQASQRPDPARLAVRIRTVLDVYEASDPAGKNALFKSVLEAVWYRKEKKTKPADFQLSFVLRSL